MVTSQESHIVKLSGQDVETLIGSSLPQDILNGASSIHDFESLPGVAGELAIKERIFAELDSGAGFIIVRPDRPLSIREIIYGTWNLARSLGVTLPQNDRDDHLYVVTDRGGKMSEGARYSQTNEGGNLHTDVVNVPGGYDYFVLGAISTGMIGGESLLVSGDGVFKKLTQKYPEAVELLRQQYRWECRGIQHDELHSRPILDLGERGEPHWCYLRPYVEEAARKTGMCLSQAQRWALDRLDECLEDPANEIRVSLAAGDMLIVNDRRLFHGRTSFTD